MSAGTGILHSEKNDAGGSTGARRRTSDPVHFVQMWVCPTRRGIEPGYEQLDIDAELARGGLVPVASAAASHDAAISIKPARRRAVRGPAGAGGVGARCRPRRSCTCTSPRGAVDLEGAGRAGRRRRARSPRPTASA